MLKYGTSLEMKLHGNLVFVTGNDVDYWLTWLMKLHYTVLTFDIMFANISFAKNVNTINFYTIFNVM